MTLIQLVLDEYITLTKENISNDKTNLLSLKIVKLKLQLYHC
jgi:hypothetical protein